MSRAKSKGNYWYKLAVPVCVIFFALTLIAFMGGQREIASAELKVNTNVASLEAQKKLAETQKALQASFERLSSGYRINSAEDDAAGLGVSEEEMAEITEMKDEQALIGAYAKSIPALSAAIGAADGVKQIVTLIETKAAALADSPTASAAFKRSALNSELTKLKNMDKQFASAIIGANKAGLVEDIADLRGALVAQRASARDIVKLTADYLRMKPTKKATDNNKKFLDALRATADKAREQHGAIEDYIRDFSEAADAETQYVMDRW